MFNINKGKNETIYLSGIFDSSCVDQAVEVFNSVTSSCTVDCSDLEYISSAGLGILVAAYKRIAGQGGKIRLMNVRENVKKIFLLVRFDKFFEMQ